jgi:hypothetical protein
MDLNRSADLRRFYDILSRLEVQVGGMRRLSACEARSEWPKQGVYFFSEKGESRLGSGTGYRIVRVGTHAVSNGSRTTLWNRLAQHKGTRSLGGNHRGSIFRKLVGQALAVREPSLAVATWGSGQSAARSVRATERALEAEVSRYIGDMPFLWLPVEDSPSPMSRRAYIERNSIALLSNVAADCDVCSDPPSPNWLGLGCLKEDVRLSGLWNSRHVHETYHPGFLGELEQYTAMSHRL